VAGAGAPVAPASRPFVYSHPWGSATVIGSARRYGVSMGEGGMEYPVYIHGLRTAPKVALTFDDGPNPPRTEQVLEILAEAHIRATFFVMGKWAERFPRTVERLLAAGHLVGNHGYSGQRPLGDYDEAEAVISHITGKPSRYLRSHTYNHAAYFQSEVSRLPGSLTIGLDIDADDWDESDPGAISRNVLDHPRLGPGAIINLHDGAEYEDPSVRLVRPLGTLVALPRIIAGLRDRNLACVALDDMELAPPVPWTWNDDPHDLVLKADAQERAAAAR
jgi:peptidoglycan/xylan/chitin deacetylase (PgdA/CDA1 family)